MVSSGLVGRDLSLQIPDVLSAYVAATSEDAAEVSGICRKFFSVLQSFCCRKFN